MAAMTTHTARVAHPTRPRRMPLRRLVAFLGSCLGGLKTLAEYHPAAVGATLWSAQYGRKPDEAEIEKRGRQ